MCQNTSCKNNVYDILFGNIQSKYEEKAIKILEDIIKKPIKKCGLFIDDDIPYLTATLG